MIMIRTSVGFDHRNRTEPGREGPLEVRITINRKPYYISTGIKVRKNEWKFGMVVDRVDCRELNERLGIVVRRIESEINAAIDEGRELDIKEIKRRVYQVDVTANGTGLLDWIKEQVELSTLGEGTVKHYRTLVARLEQYGGLNRWADLTAENIVKWDAWLHNLTKQQTEAERLSGEPPARISDAAIYNYHKCLKALLNKALRYDRISTNPYTKLRGQFKRGERDRVDYLTEEEMRAFEALHPIAGSQMAMARDLFVLQMYTGMAYSDIQRFDIGDYRLVDGVWQNVGQRVKTGVAYISHLLPPVVEVLERYNYQVPRMSNTDYNRCLKALGMAVGIERPLHSHMARHTFATYMLANGARIENVSRMLGHTNIVQTQRYAKVLAQSVHDDFARIEQKLKTKK